METKRLLKLAAAASHPNRQLVAAAAASKAESLSALQSTDLDDLLLQASDIASAYCDVRSVGSYPPTLSRQSIIEQIILPDLPYSPRVADLYLSMSPVEVSAVSVDGVALSLSDLFIDPVGILSFLPTSTQRFWNTGAVIEVTMDAGYVSPVQKALPSPPTGPDMPSDIARAVILIAQQIYGSASRDEFGLVAETDTHNDLGTLSKRWSDANASGGIPMEARNYLGVHRRLI